MRVQVIQSGYGIQREDLKKALNRLKRSIWVFHLNTGSCNGCDIEILDVLTPYFDVERFGIKLVGSPRHADLALLTGPITIKTLSKVVRALYAMPRPRLVLAIGACAVGGGIWFNSYSTIGGFPKLLDVFEDLGIHIAIGAGGAIHAHPMGPRAGAKAFRQAIEATLKGIPLEEYAADHMELKTALEAWSKGPLAELLG